MYTHQLTQKKAQLNKYIKMDWNEEIITLLKKHQYIKKFTTSTLVPLAVMMDNKTFRHHVKDGFDFKINNTDQFIFLEDPLLIMYFNILGLNYNNLYSSTLVPLGILTVLNHLYT